MKAKLIALGAASLLALCACSSTSADDESAKVILLGNEPQNVQPVILLQHQTTGKLACCRDTGEVTAEDCARVLEANTIFSRPTLIPPAAGERTKKRRGGSACCHG